MCHSVQGFPSCRLSADITIYRYFTPTNCSRRPNPNARNRLPCAEKKQTSFFCSSAIIYINLFSEQRGLVLHEIAFLYKNHSTSTMAVRTALLVTIMPLALQAVMAGSSSSNDGECCVRKCMFSCTFYTHMLHSEHIESLQVLLGIIRMAVKSWHTECKPSKRQICAHRCDSPHAAAHDQRRPWQFSYACLGE